MTARRELDENIAGLRLIDNHVHGFWTSPVDRSRFENGLNEANTDPLAGFDSSFDTQIGFAVRAHCAPLLELAPHADPDSYWECRSRHSESELAVLFLHAAGVSDWLVDTGTRDVAGLDEVGHASGGHTPKSSAWRKSPSRQRRSLAIIWRTTAKSSGRGDPRRWPPRPCSPTAAGSPATCRPRPSGRWPMRPLGGAMRAE